MSLVNIFATSKRVVLLTDTALYDGNGLILDFRKKCVPIESWTGALTFRGDAWGMTTALGIAEMHGSFDEFVERSGAEIEAAHRDALMGPRLGGQEMFRLHVAGWSERQDRARVLRLRTPDAPLEPGEAGPPYTWTEQEGVYQQDFDLMALCRLRRQGAEPDVDWNPATFDPRKHGVPVAEEQRRTPATAVAGGAAGRYVIGGALHATVVTRAGVETIDLCEWPDAIGGFIEPAPFDYARWPKAVPLGIPWSFEKFTAAVEAGVIDIETFEVDRAKLARLEATAPLGSGTSRQQRRAAKAQARKAPAHAS